MVGSKMSKCLMMAWRRMKDKFDRKYEMKTVCLVGQTRGQIPVAISHLSRRTIRLAFSYWQIYQFPWLAFISWKASSFHERQGTNANVNPFTIQLPVMTCKPPSAGKYQHIREEEKLKWSEKGDPLCPRFHSIHHNDTGGSFGRISLLNVSSVGSRRLSLKVNHFW